MGNELVIGHKPNIEASIIAVNRFIYGRKRYSRKVGKTEKFGDRVKRLRLAQEPKMSQSALATLCGIKQSSLSVIESGVTQPDKIKASTLAALAAKLKTTQTYLITGIETDAKPGADPLLEQLVSLYIGLCGAGRHALVAHANFLHASENPAASPANPYGKRKKEVSKQ